jgi:molecular chaperone GrpE (heat shock protein)
VPVSAPPAAAADGDRKQLVDTLIYVRDRATSTALTDRIARDLQAIGVTEIRPNGEPFDPSRHEAGGSTDTTDPQQDGRIAAVETPGYLDRGRVLRLPVVTVYRRNP